MPCNYNNFFLNTWLHPTLELPDMARYDKWRKIYKRENAGIIADLATHITGGQVTRPVIVTHGDTGVSLQLQACAEFILVATGGLHYLFKFEDFLFISF